MTNKATKLSDSSRGQGAPTSNETNIDFDEHILNQPSVRNILGFVEKYDRADVQEILSQMNCHWLISLDDYKIPIEYPSGMITQMHPLNEDHLFVLIENDLDEDSENKNQNIYTNGEKNILNEQDNDHLDYREVHQIIRELTIGIYVLNQHPYLQLEANIDESTTCHLPPAYIDTKLGQIMINTDYWLKALWHGSFFQRDKRIKFSERWRQVLDVDTNGISQTKKDVLTEFLNAGLTDIADDEEYSIIFENKTSKTSHKINKNDSSLIAFGVNMNGNMFSSSNSPYERLANDLNLTDEQMKDKFDFFMQYVNDISIQMTFGLNSIKQFKNLYEIEPNFEINSIFRADCSRIDNSKFEQLKPIISSHEQFLRDNFEKKRDIRKNLKYLKIVSFLVPLFIGLKKRMKIPNMNTLLPMMSGEETRTERELPPLILASNFKSKLFNYNNTNNKYFNLHGGIQYELETCLINDHCESDYETQYQKITKSASKFLDDFLNSEQQLQKYPIPVIKFKNKRYWCLRIDFESYYSSFPFKPFWVSKLTDELYKLKPKRLPMTDIQIYDLFKKFLGYKRATKNKNVPVGLREASKRGLIGIFQAFIRKIPVNRLSKHDEFGLGLMHYAAIYNKPLIVSSLIMIGIDLNIKQQIDYMAIGPMPLHYAARCGSLDTLSCLLANYASISFSDHEGWTPIHHACFFDNVAIVKLLVRKQAELLEIATKSESRKTPILIAASGGSLETIKCLIELGANISYQEDNGYNLIHIAAKKSHTNIIRYFIKKQYKQLPAWQILLGMLDHEKDQDAAVNCLQLLTHRNKEHWKEIVASGGIRKLFEIIRRYGINLLQSKTTVTAEVANLQFGKHLQFKSSDKQDTNNREIIVLNSLSVICNLSDHDDVKQDLCQMNDLSNILINLLEFCCNKDILSRVAILIADVTLNDNKNKNLFAEKGLTRLLNLLNSDIEDLLVNCVNTIEIICMNNESNQNFCCENGIIQTFNSLLELNSDLLKSSVAAAISSIVNNNYSNQIQALNNNLIKPIVELLKSRNMTVQLKACLALESLALNNQKCQEEILNHGAEVYMIKLLEIKSNMDDWSIIVREQAANTLWTLAGALKPQRIMIAEKIGISQIISMLMSKSEKLQFVGCKCMVSLVFENYKYQNVILKENCVDHLIRLLKFDKISNRVILACIETIGALCVDIAHVNNLLAQTVLSDKGAIDLLVDIIENPINDCIQIEAAHTYACLVLNKPISDDEEKKTVDLKLLIDLLVNTKDLDLRLKAGLAISVLAFNNNSIQHDIKQCGGISFSKSYSRYFEEIYYNPIQLCKACFQIVVLARLINDRDHVWLTALGISNLSKLLLNKENEQVIIQTASYLSSLAHSRGGIIDAMIACDIVNILCDHLYSLNDQIRFTSAITIGYLTYNRTASRLLLHNCRNLTTLFDQLMTTLRHDSKISPQFIDSYRTALKLGIPKLLIRKRVNAYVNEKKQLNNENKFNWPNNYDNQTEYIIENQQSIEVLNKSKYLLRCRSQSAPMSKQLSAKFQQSRLANEEFDSSTKHNKNTHIKPSLGMEKRPNTSFTGR